MKHLGLPSPAKGSTGDINRLLVARSLRAFGDGYVAVLLPLYLSRLGYDALGVGLISAAALLGSSVLTLALGLFGYRMRRRQALLAAALLMAATGSGFAGLEGFWPILMLAFVGTLNPSGGDVSVFLPLEHTILSHLVADDQRTAAFARYAFVGSASGALGALSVGLLDWLAPVVSPSVTTSAMFALYGGLGLLTFLIYLGLSPRAEVEGDKPAKPLGPSRSIVYRLAALFSVDSFGGGLVINSLLTLWLTQRFGLSATSVGAIFFVTGLCSAISYFAAVPLARRFGLINTMVYTHIPSSVFLMLAAVAPTAAVAIVFLTLRSLLSQMDVPTRSSYVMAVVRPEERPAAASVTAVPRSLASAVAPLLGGWLFSASPFGWPLILAGGLKIAYDLALLRQFAGIKAPEDR